jgi:spoIIIJ-associated protein
MIKIEAKSLEDAYLKAAKELSCSVSELNVVVIQQPSKKLFGLLAKPAIVVAECKTPSSAENTAKDVEEEPVQEMEPEQKMEQVPSYDESASITEEDEWDLPEEKIELYVEEEVFEDKVETIEEEEPHYEDLRSTNSAISGFFEDRQSVEEIAATVKEEINDLFDKLCFSLNAIEVSVYDDTTLLIEFSGEDAALLIGKEGYRYKALSYMIFNWINAKYRMQLRLEIAEFLKNQEESISRYLLGVYEEIDNDGRARTKILDGVLVQIALKQLRERYHDKYVAIRTTRDGSKYIIINEYNSY